MKTLLVRLKPYSPKHGIVLQRYTYRGIKFQEDRGWYKVEEALGEALRALKQTHDSPHSPDAFDVMTEKEAFHLEQIEEAEATKQGVKSPIDVRNADREDSREKKGIQGASPKTSSKKPKSGTKKKAISNKPNLGKPSASTPSLGKPSSNKISSDTKKRMVSTKDISMDDATLSEGKDAASESAQA